MGDHRGSRVTSRGFLSKRTSSSLGRRSVAAIGSSQSGIFIAGVVEQGRSEQTTRERHSMAGYEIDHERRMIPAIGAGKDTRIGAA
jgi:hypothetical protein